jgi:tRNA(Ile)-lysidine synthase
VSFQRRADYQRQVAAACRRLLPGVSRVVVAVSGGADSCALLDLLLRFGYRVVVYHLNHGLRPEAHADAAFVAARVARYRRRGYAVELVSEAIDVAAVAETRGVAWEQAGRDERYLRLEAVAGAWNCQAICTGHHRGDLAETVVMNLLRGCDAIGLAGIPERRDTAGGLAVVRPLLRVSAACLRGHLRRRGLDWCEDASNQDRRFTRNRIRHEVLAQWEQATPGTADEFARRAIVAQRALAGHDRALSKVWRAGQREVPLRDVRRLSEEDQGLLWRRLAAELALPINRTTIARMADLAVGAPGRRLDLGVMSLWSTGQEIRWERTDGQPWEACWLTMPGETDCPMGTLTVTAGVPRVSALPPNEAILDVDVLRGDLLVRPAREDERWQALGAPGSKTLFSYLADRGVPAQARRRYPVVADGDGAVWVPGHGIAERAAISARSHRAWRLSFYDAS